MPTLVSNRTLRGPDGRFQGPPLTKKQIIAWARAHFARFGRYPTTSTGPVPEAPRETWRRIYGALYRGGRGLRRPETLTNLLKWTFGESRLPQKPVLTVKQIVTWARAHHARTGRWPTHQSGRVLDANGEKWSAIDDNLRKGDRGLPGGSSVSRLLNKVVGRSRRLRRGRLTVRQIVAWAKEHRRRTGSWPTVHSGPIASSRGRTWQHIDSALYLGNCGLPGGDSLSRLLHRRVGKPQGPPAMRIPHAQILRWADAHHRKHGRWPSKDSGPIDSCPGLTWSSVHHCLYRRRRAGISLAMLLKARRGESAKTCHRRFTQSEIMAWAKSFHRRVGRWPHLGDGHADGDCHWKTVHDALVAGEVRGIPAGTTLRTLLVRRCGARPTSRSESPLSMDDILRWADRHHERTGRWPTDKAGPVVGGPHDLTWAKVSNALRRGGRTLPPEGGLALMLMKRRGVRHRNFLPKLSVEQILEWADAFFKRNRQWPKKTSGPVFESPDVTWSAINTALVKGGRGLPKGPSLRMLIRKARGADRKIIRTTITEREILTWAVAHHRRRAVWPTKRSGMIHEVPGQSWGSIDLALRHGLRGLPRGRSLAKLLDKVRGAPAATARKGPLKLRDVMLWAKAHARRTGQWPDRYDGRVIDAKGETWFGIDEALRSGLRGLPKVRSLGILFSGLPRPRVLAMSRR